MSVFEQAIELARANDPGCRVALQRFTDPELVGELIVQVYRSGTPAGRAAAFAAMERPFQRGWWQGFKRVYKLSEEALDAEAFALCAHRLDLSQRAWPITNKTLQYLQRRTYRHLKGVAKSAPDRFVEHLEHLLPRYAGADRSILLGRLLRLATKSGAPPVVLERFVARLENPYAAFAPEQGPKGDELLELVDAELVKPHVEDKAPARLAPAVPPKVWKGPIFSELWTRDPARLVRLLERTRHEQTAGALAFLLAEKVGEGLLAIELDRIYALLHHPVRAAFRLALSQLAGRARPGRLRFGELVPLFERAAAAKPGPDWPVLEDLLYVFHASHEDGTDENAAAEREQLAPALKGLLVGHKDAEGAGAVVVFLSRHLAARLGPPLFDAPGALALLGSRRPDVLELGRRVIANVADQVVFTSAQLLELVKSPLAEEDPDLLHRILTGTKARPDGYLPPTHFSGLSDALDAASESAFAALRRALFEFDERGALLASVPLELVTRKEKRTRALGLDLLSGMVRRGSVVVGAGVVTFLGSPFEDVVTWAREVVQEAAAEGRLPNEALYRMLDAEAQDVQGFGRKIVRDHLAKFAKAELIVFLAESPDAATADLGIELYEKELAGKEGFDLRKLVPMFRILLYKVAQARAEKERLLGTLRRWALAAPENARLAVSVVAEFRRTEAKVDFGRAVTLMAVVHDRFPEVEVPFATATVFAGRKA